jgi:hypothetical protein
MWDLAPIYISYKLHNLYVGYSFFQYETGVLQTPSFKAMTYSSGPCHAVLTVPNDALVGGSSTICNDLEKNASHICAITPKWLVNLKLQKNSL